MSTKHTLICKFNREEEEEEEAAITGPDGQPIDPSTSKENTLAPDQAASKESAPGGEGKEVSELICCFFSIHSLLKM